MHLDTTTRSQTALGIKGKNLIRNVASLSAVQIVNYIFPLISVPIISRIIGPEKFGVITYAAAFISYFTMFIGFGFDYTGTRKVAKDPTNVQLRRTVFSEVFFAQLFLFGIALILFWVCLYHIPILATEKKVAIFTSFLCISQLLSQNWVFQAMQDLHKVALLNLVAKICFTIAVILVVRQKNDYYWQPFIFYSIEVVIAAVSLAWAVKKYQLILLPVPFRKLLNLLWEERIVFLSLASRSFYITTNTIMLGLMVNALEVGYFTAAQKLITVATSIITIPLSQSLYPFIGNAFGESREKGIKSVQVIFPIVLLITGVCAVCLFLVGPFALRWFYGRAFEPSVPAFLIMAFVPMIMAIGNMFGTQILLNLKMDKVFFKITLGGAFIGLILNYLMIRNQGYIGTAWNWLIVEIYISVAMYVALRIYGINPINLSDFNGKALRKIMAPQ